MKETALTHAAKVLTVGLQSKIEHYLVNFIPLLGDFEVEQAATPLEALAKINAFEPKLVIYGLDSAEPAAQEALKEIRQKHAQCHILVLLSVPEEEGKLKKAGVNDCLLMPFDFTELSQRVKMLLPLAENPKHEKESARLLVADDEPLINEYLEETFGHLGLEVYTATDGKTALKLFKQKKCNLALLDLRMPELNGLDLVRLLESSVHPPKPKAIFILTAGLGEPLAELKRLGHPIIAKPFDTENLKERVLETCQKHDLALKK